MRQDFVLMVQCRSIFFGVLVWLLSSQQVLSVEVLLFAFDLAATTLVLVCGICSSCGSEGISVLSSIDSIIKIDRSIGNSDPRLRIVLIHRPNSNFNSIFDVLKTGRDFQYRSNPHISLNPSFWLRSWIISK